MQRVDEIGLGREIRYYAFTSKPILPTWAEYIFYVFCHRRDDLFGCRSGPLIIDCVIYV